MSKVVFIQRYFYNFREGLFDYLHSKDLNFILINSVSSKGRVKVHNDKACNSKYISKTFNFNINKNIVLFPFLFYKLYKLKPKVIVTEGGQNTINNLQVFLYCYIFKINYILWDLGKGYKDFGNSFLRKLYMKSYTFIANRSSLIYGYNSSSKKYFIDLGIDKNKIIVLNNTVDTISLKKVIDLSNTKFPSDLSVVYKSEITYIIFVGSLLPSKNIEELKNIMTLLGDKYHLLIIGSGSIDYERKLKEYFSEINCSFHGYKKPEELLPYYSVSSFSILPGLGGLAINQSMAYSVPVLCTVADGAEKDIVINNETGFLYNDIEELTEYIKSKKTDDWEIMGKKASHLLFSEFSIEKECERIINGIKYLNNEYKG